MNKKLILSLITFVALAGVVIPGIAIGATPVTPSAPDSCEITKDVLIDYGCTMGACDFSTGANCGLCCLLNSVITVTDWVFVFIMIVVSLMIIIGAFNYVTSGGDPGKTASGRNYIMYAAIGLVIALFAKAIPYVVMLLVGMKVTP